MKFWSISAVMCCLLADIFVGQHVYIKHRPAYTVTTNRTDLVITWNNQPIVHGIASNMQVAVSPDGQSVAWTITRQNGVRHIDSSEDPIYEGTLWMAHANQKPLEIVDTRSSRGFVLEFGPNYQDDKAGWHPVALQWDSTSQYLYFRTQPWVTRSLLWQVKPGERVPRIVESGGDHWLVKQWFGPDRVVIQGLRYERNDPDTKMHVTKDYENCYLYTPEDIAKPECVQSEKRVKPPVKDWPK